jgi:hypothetical protein
MASNRRPKGGEAYARELASLAKLGKTALWKRYEEVFGTKARTSNPRQLRAAIARRLTREPESSRLSAPPRAPMVPRPEPPPGRDPRLPTPGTVIAREYAGTVHEVTVLADAFVYRGDRHRSLSAVARLITGTSWNGLVFFGLAPRAVRAAGQG